MIDTPTVVTMSGGVTPREVGSLLLGGGAGASVLELREDATLSALSGIEMSSGGVLRGDGVVSTGALEWEIPEGAEVSIHVSLGKKNDS